MKLLLTLLLAHQVHAGWVEGTIMGVRDDSPKASQVIFVNTYTNMGPAENTWVTMSTSSLGLPSDAKSLFLGGILIITHGTTIETCDLTITFRAPGNNLDPGNYIGQVIEPFVGGGQRSPMSVWIPVVNGNIEFFWKRNTFNQWPLECAYGINLSAQAYLR